MTKKINVLGYVCFLVIISIFFVIPVSANINITFQSDNEKLIKTYDIDNGYIQTSSNFTNQTINLPYDNYQIKMFATNNKIQGNNGTFIINNLTSFNNDRYLIIWIVIIVVLLFLFYKTVENKI